jgi:serine/threonine protein kinase
MKKDIKEQHQRAEVQFNGDYFFAKVIGEGSFGTVYIGTDVSNGNELAIKREEIVEELLEYEAYTYKKLEGGVGIPRVSSFWNDDKYNYMAMERLGPSLDDLFEFCNHTFSLKTVLMIADQMVKICLY